jgi:hypothetical protein
VFEPIARAALAEEFAASPKRALSDAERARLTAFDAHTPPDPLTHYLLFEHGDEVIGHCFGKRESRGRYYMCVTAIRSDHQRRGIYGAFLTRLLACADAVGFLEVFSRHRADNNEVLIPKLRRGFVIGGFEIAPKYGIIVELRRYANATIRALHGYRVDATRHAAALLAPGVVND